MRLTAEDGYQAQRSYSIASAPGGPSAITVERLDDGEVSPYLADEVRPGDRFEVRGPIGGWFVWEPEDGGPFLLVAGGSGVVPLMAMARHRAASGSRRAHAAPALVAHVGGRDLPRRAEALAARGDGFEVVHTLTRAQPEGWDGVRRRVDVELLARGRLAGGRAAARVRVRADRVRRERSPAGSSRSATTPAA